MGTFEPAPGHAAILWRYPSTVWLSQGIWDLLEVWRSLRAMDGARLAPIPKVTGRRLRFGTGGEFPSLGHFLVTQPRPVGSAAPSQGLQRPFWLSDPETRDNSDDDSLKADREGSPKPWDTVCPAASSTRAA